MFNEVCIYEAKLTKLDEIEELMRKWRNFTWSKMVLLMYII